MITDKKWRAVVGIALSLATPATLCWYGFVLCKLWLWFATPFGAPPIGIAHALGLSLLLKLASGIKRDDDERDWLLSWAKTITRGVAVSLMALAIGAIVQTFMDGTTP